MNTVRDRDFETLERQAAQDKRWTIDPLRRSLVTYETLIDWPCRIWRFEVQPTDQQCRVSLIRVSNGWPIFSVMIFHDPIMGFYCWEATPLAEIVALPAASAAFESDIPTKIKTFFELIDL